LKVNKETKNWQWKETTKNGKIVKMKYYPKVGVEYKENINK